MTQSAHAKTATRRAGTPPKGRPTPKRNEQGNARKQENARSRRLEWAVLAIIALALVVALVVLGGDGGGAPLHGVPVGGHRG